MKSIVFTAIIMLLSVTALAQTTTTTHHPTQKINPTESGARDDRMADCVAANSGNARGPDIKTTLGIYSKALASCQAQLCNGGDTDACAPHAKRPHPKSPDDQ